MNNSEALVEKSYRCVIYYHYYSHHDIVTV